MGQRQSVIGCSVVFGSSQSDEELEEAGQAEVNLRDENDRDQIIIDGSAFCYRISRVRACDYGIKEILRLKIDDHGYLRFSFI